MGAEQVGIGILGGGRIADLQCLGYLARPNARIAAVCDVDEDRAKGRAAEWGASMAYTDLDQMLKDPAVDAVEVLTPHHLHESHEIASLEAGKQVALQKPPTRTLEELDRVAEARDRSGVTLRIFERFMLYPPHVRARELIRDGAIGEPLSIRLKTAGGRIGDGWSISPSTQAWRLDTQACGGGATTFDHGYHCFNMARFFMPEEVERVHSFMHWTELGPKRRIDGPALISWKYAGAVPRYGSWEVIASLGMRLRSRYYASVGARPTPC